MIKFGGIANPYEIGNYSVEKNTKALLRYRYLHESLMRVAAGHLPAREDWDLKVGLGKHLYEDAEATDQIRKRILELRSTASALNHEPDAALTLLMDELVHANTDLELLIGIYQVLKPAMLETYKKHMGSTQQIVDQPTVRIFRTLILDLEDQLAWGEEMIQTLRQASISLDNGLEFKEKMLAYLTVAGGIDGSLGKKAEFLPRWRSHAAYTPPQQSVRDPQKMGPTTWARTGVLNPPDDETKHNLLLMMRVRQEEMTAAELVANVMYNQKNMPWEFYYDLARHIWDEVRHALFGQAALEVEGIDWMSRPQYTSDYDVNAGKITAAQYTWLSIGIEEGAMKRPGKVGEYEYCRDHGNNLLITQFQDYDWADEVTHANFGRRWAPELVGEDIVFVRQLASKELEHFFMEVNRATEQLNQSRP